MLDQIELKSLWEKVVDRVQHVVIHPTFWRALEQAIPIIADEGLFVVGFSSVNLYMAGHLQVSEHKNAIEKALRDFTGDIYTVRIVEAENLQDWQVVKHNEERRRLLKESESENQRVETAAQKAWEKLLEQSGRKYAALPNRGLPQFRARYVIDMLNMMSNAIDELMVVDGDKVDEYGERFLGRVIERVSQLSEIPACTIGLELLRVRAAKKQK